MIEPWHWGIIGVGLALLFGIPGYFYYKSQQGLLKHRDYHHKVPPAIIIEENKTPPPYHAIEVDHNSYLHDSRPTTANTCVITPLSPPPVRFFHDRRQTRWMPPAITKSPSPSSFQTNTTNTDATDNNQRFPSLSPFFDYSHSSSPSPSPVSTCPGQTRTPSPIFAKLASSWSTWKKHT